MSKAHEEILNRYFQVKFISNLSDQYSTQQSIFNSTIISLTGFNLKPPLYLNLPQFLQNLSSFFTPEAIKSHHRSLHFQSSSAARAFSTVSMALASSLMQTVVITTFQLWQLLRFLKTLMTREIKMLKHFPLFRLLCERWHLLIFVTIQVMLPT